MSVGVEWSERVLCAGMHSLQDMALGASPFVGFDGLRVNTPGQLGTHIAVGSCSTLPGGFCVRAVATVRSFASSSWFPFMHFCSRFICHVWFGMHPSAGSGLLRFSDSNWICMSYKILRVGKLERFSLFVSDFFFETVAIWCSP